MIEQALEERPVSPTILRLRRIQPGQRIVYYRGTLEDDLFYAQGDYRALLEDIKAEALRLYRHGLAELNVEPVEREKSFGRRSQNVKAWTEYHYIATGCRA